MSNNQISNEPNGFRLEIESLNGKPGVLSARYARLPSMISADAVQAGEDKNAEKNIEKVLYEMEGIKNRKAKFKTIISLVINHKEYLFEGVINGSISKEKIGKKGFGYDPVFIPEGFEKSFAEMHLEEKNKISHRAIAIKKFAAFLSTLKS